LTDLAPRDLCTGQEFIFAAPTSKEASHSKSVAQRRHLGDGKLVRAGPFSGFFACDDLELINGLEIEET